MPVSAPGQKTDDSFGVLPPEVLANPFYYLRADDFKKYAGTEFLLFTETGAIAIVLLEVTQAKAAKSARRVSRNSSQPVTSETFSLSFKLPTEGLKQETYRLQHPSLGEFDLFLVPEARGKFLLHAVINRI